MKKKSINLLLQLSAILAFFGYQQLVDKYILIFIGFVVVICILLTMSKIKEIFSYTSLIFAVLLIYYICSFVYAYNFGHAIKFTSVLILFWIIQILLINNEDWEYNWIVVLIIFSSVHVLFTLIQVFFPVVSDAIANIILNPVQLGLRSTLYMQKMYAGISGQAGSNSFFIAVFLAVFTSLSITLEKSKKKYIVLSLIGFIALNYTGKRGAFIGVIVASIVSVLLYLKKDWKFVLKLCFIGIIVSLLFYILYKTLPNITIIFDRFFNNNGNFTSGRDVIYSIMWNQFLKNPVYGNGLGSTSSFLSLTTVSTGHNIYLQMLTENGIVGLIILVIFLGYNFFFTIKVLKNVRDRFIFSKKRSKYLCFLLGSLNFQIIFIVMGLVGNTFYDKSQLIVYIIMTAVPISINRRIPVIK